MVTTQPPLIKVSVNTIEQDLRLLGIKDHPEE